MKPIDSIDRRNLQINQLSRQDAPETESDLNLQDQNQNNTASGKRNKALKNSLFAVLVLLFIGGGIFTFSTYTVGQQSEVIHGSFPVVIPEIRYGFRVDEYHFSEHTIQPNQFFFDMVRDHGISYNQVLQVVERSRDVFDIRRLQASRSYVIISDKSRPDTALYMVYEPGHFSYVLFDFQDDMHVELVERDIEIQYRSGSGVITSSLWNAMRDNGMSFRLIAMMEDALAWTIDFHRVQPGDRFKLLFEEKLVEGEVKDVGKIAAAYFETQGKPYYAFYFEHENFTGYYDTEARPMKRAFLRAPVQFSRISSRYNLNRMHPILRRNIPHLGTDFAAPYGTPIVAVADGTVQRASYSAGNGYYVRIKHDRVYETQYLHMQRFASGIRNGVRVRQGQVIGYVGSTGLATGPHVCFRFWKNGKQVDFLKEDLPSPEPLTEKELPGYFAYMDSLKQIIDGLHFAVPAREEEKAPQI